MPNNNPQQTSQQQRSTESSAKLTDRIEKTAEQTTNSAIQRVRDAREQAASGLEYQRGQVADRIRRLGGVIRAGSETLSTDDPYSQNLLASAGDRIEQVADYIESLTPGQLADDVQTFARQRPALFFGGTFLLGLGLGRFVKSSAQAAGGGRRSNITTYRDESFESDVSEPAGEQAATTKTRRTTGAQGGTGASYGASGTGGTGGTTLPYGVGSSSASTVTSGSSYGPNSGVQTGAPKDAPKQETGSAKSSTSTDTLRTQSGAPSSAPNSASTTPRETERGQGSKS